MTVNNIYNALNNMFPFNLALEFDNTGLIIGDRNSTVKKAVVALDCTTKVLDFAIDNGAELIITHHPVIFTPLKSITDNTLVYKIIKSGVSVISAHTNLDTAEGGVNDCLAKCLGLENISPVICPDGFTFRKGVLPAAMQPEEFAKFAAKKLGTGARFVCGNRAIKTVAVCSGSGSDMFGIAAEQSVDAFVSSEIKHNVFISSFDADITSIDCGHFATENVVITPLCNKLTAALPEVQFIPYTQGIIKNI